MTRDDGTISRREFLVGSSAALTATLIAKYANQLEDDGAIDLSQPKIQT